MTAADLEKIYDRLRLTEQATAEQSVTIAGLTKRVDAMITKWDGQMDKMWRLVYICVGAVLALSLGPRAVEKLMQAVNGSSAAAPLTYLKPMDDRNGLLI